MLPRLNIAPMRSSSYYATANFNSLFSPAANITHYHAFFVPNNVTLDRLQFASGSTFTGTASVRLGIYADNGGIPGNLILDAGTVSVTASSTVYAITISQSVSAGTLYWLAFNAQTAGTVNSYAGQTGSPAAGQLILNFLTASDFTMVTSYRQTGVTGAFANAVSPTQTGNAIRMGVRVA
jgi:hypothetical protein